MSSYNSPTTLNEFKEQYAKRVEKATPSNAILTKRIPFNEANSLGGMFHQPVALRNETGFTLGTTGGVTYNPVQAMAVLDAQVTAPQMTLVSQISLDAIIRTENAPRTAVETAMTVVIQNIVQSFDNRNEQYLLYGGLGMAVTASATASTATSITYAIKPAEWAPAIWEGNQGAALDFYNGSTLVNSATVAPNGVQAPATGGYPVLQSLDPINATITVLFNATDVANATLLAGTNLTVFWGGSFGKEQTGLFAITQNTGTLFNINAATYDLWKGNVLAVPSSPSTGFQLTFGFLQTAAAAPVSRGYGMEDYAAVVSPFAWAGLMTSQAAQRLYDSSYSAKVLENGATELKFATLVGTLEIIAHPFMKAGYCLMVPLKRCQRIGSTPARWEMQIINGQSGVFVPLPTSTLKQAVRYASEQVFCNRPAALVLITGIVNPAL